MRLAGNGYLFGDEAFVPGAAGPQSILLSIPDGAAVGHLMLRNADANGRCVRARSSHRGVSAHTGIRAPGIDAAFQDKRRLSLADARAPSRALNLRRSPPPAMTWH